MTTCCYFKIVLCNWINEIIVEDSSFAWTCHGAKNRWKTHGYYCKPLLIETPVNEWEQWRHDSNTSSSRLWATVTRQQHDNNTAAAHWLIEWLIMTLGWLIIKPRTDPKKQKSGPRPFRNPGAPAPQCWPLQIELKMSDGVRKLRFAFQQGLRLLLAAKRKSAKWNLTIETCDRRVEQRWSFFKR